VLSRFAVVEGEDGQQHEIPQIVYYQKGVGTNFGDKYWGGPQILPHRSELLLT
jgi:hypothetical protein